MKISTIETLDRAGIPHRQYLGRTMVAERFVSHCIDGIPVSYSRRRYGSRPFCWAYYFRDGEWFPLGDPWPGVNWPKRDLLQAVAYLSQALAVEA